MGAFLWAVAPIQTSGEVTRGAAPQVAPVASQAVPLSRIIGTVLDRQTGQPVFSARVVLLDRTGGQVGATAADATGSFALPPALPGMYDLRVELLGYRTARDSVYLAEDEDEVLTIYMASEAIDLDPLVVRVPRTVAYYMQGFERRRATGNGTFITREQIERRRGTPTSELLRSLGGLRVVYGSRGEAALFLRGTCRPQVYVDGVAIHQSVSIDMAVIADDIEGIEVYSNATIPAQYASQSACAAILVWTRPPVKGQGRKVSPWKLIIAGGVLLTMLILGR